MTLSRLPLRCTRCHCSFRVAAPQTRALTTANNSGNDRRRWLLTQLGAITHRSRTNKRTKPSRLSLSLQSLRQSLASRLPSLSLPWFLTGVDQRENDSGNDRPTPYDGMTASVRAYHSNEDALCQQETEAVTMRRTITRHHVRKFLTHTNTDSDSGTGSGNDSESKSLPSVALCLSGGGYRAMLGSLAALNQFQRSGLLSCADYVAGLSGSTWAMTQLYSRPSIASEPLSMQSILDSVRKQTSQPLFSLLSLAALNPVIDVVRRTISEKLTNDSGGGGGSVSVNDIYAWFINQRILSTLVAAADSDISTSASTINDYLSTLTLSSQSQSLATGQLPFPLYTAITPHSQIQFEFSPYEIGSHELRSFVPTWSFNRPFDGGTSVGNRPTEPHLSTLLTMFSSAHCTDLQHQFRELLYQIKNDRIKETGRELFELLQTKEFLNLNFQEIYPFAPLMFNNFLYHLPRDDRVSDSEVYESSTLSLMDAGLSFNYPIIPLVQPSRAVDCIVLCDFTSPPEAMTGVYLESVKRYCAMHQLPFPSIADGEQPLGCISVKREEKVSQASIELQTDSVADEHGGADANDDSEALYRACHSRVTIFRGNPQRRIPTIIYIPLLSNARFDADFCPRAVFATGGFTSTLNFVYSEEQSALLCGLVEANIAECEPVIRDTMNWIQREKGRRKK